MRVLEVLHAAHHRPTTEVYRWVQGVLWVLIIASIVLFAVELALEPLPEAWAARIRLADAVVLWVFGVDVTVRVLTFRPPALAVFNGSRAWRVRTHVVGRLRYLFTPFVLIDLLTVLALVPALRGLRALRLLRLLKGVRLFRYSHPFLGVLRSFSESWLLYSGTLGFLLGIVTLGGLSLYLLEAELNDHVDSVGDGIWWALVTITTVGFGDITPVTAGGRIVAGTVMVLGMFTLALFAGVVSTTILNVISRLREEAFRMSTHVNHIVICGYHPGSRMLLDALLAELPRGERPELIIFAPIERPDDVPDEFTWVRGDPTKESELDKVKIASAHSVIVIGSRAQSIQEADATTLLTLFTLRSYLSKDDTAKQRDRPMHVTAEILDQENVQHAHAAGADEVIETTRLGFSMIAHSVSAPGSGHILSKVASAGAASVYVGECPFSEPRRFEDVVAEVRRSHGITIMGLQDPDDDERLELNPKPDREVAPGTRLIYLASSRVL